MLITTSLKQHAISTYIYIYIQQMVTYCYLLPILNALVLEKCWHSIALLQVAALPCGEEVSLEIIAIMMKSRYFTVTLRHALIMLAVMVLVLLGEVWALKMEHAILRLLQSLLFLKTLTMVPLNVHMMMECKLLLSTRPKSLFCQVITVATSKHSA